MGTPGCSGSLMASAFPDTEKTDWPMPEAKPLTQPLETLPHGQEHCQELCPGAAWGQLGQMPPRWGRQPSSMAKRDPWQMGRCPAGTPELLSPQGHSVVPWTTLPLASSRWAGLCQLHPGPILVRVHAPISQPHFWTFLAGQKGYFCQALWGHDGQFPIFASTCPGDVSWQAGGGERGQGSHKMLQHLFLAECSQCMTKPQGCCWGVPGSHCIAESFSHQWNALNKPQSPSHLPRGFLQGPVTRLKDAGTD